MTPERNRIGKTSQFTLAGLQLVRSDVKPADIPTVYELQRGSVTERTFFIYFFGVTRFRIIPILQEGSPFPIGYYPGSIPGLGLPTEGC